MREKLMDCLAGFRENTQNRVDLPTIKYDRGSPPRLTFRSPDT
jgi:hypothetical protein